MKFPLAHSSPEVARRSVVSEIWVLEEARECSLFVDFLEGADHQEPMTMVLRSLSAVVSFCYRGRYSIEACGEVVGGDVGWGAGKHRADRGLHGNGSGSDSGGLSKPGALAMKSQSGKWK